MQRKGNTLVPALAVILSLCAAIGVFAFSIWPKDDEFDVNPSTVRSNTNTVQVNSNNENTNAAVDTNTQSANVNAAVNTNASVGVTKDWKTYTNPTRGYTIKYPPTWTATTNAMEPEAVNISPPEPNPGLHITHNLIVTPTPKIDASDCRNMDLEDKKSTVEVNGKTLTRTIHGCSFDWVSTYFPQPTGYEGYFDVTWAKPLKDEYPEYELMLHTFAS